MKALTFIAALTVAGCATISSQQAIDAQMACMERAQAVPAPQGLAGLETVEDALGVVERVADIIGARVAKINLSQSLTECNLSITQE